ncbi:dTDP-D-glucose 4,6-dehydratase-like [Paramacrobiotus metropolitanus]|uniref:dTDP-D-glucose 4,6-dehydratase-like n=1 Tax=Paramacrobiotus metropolitanus TaxID=2943436 RepID=UPI002446433E|nr:dTDP-D-glucose 4,6-dehydratase-like [Paramacrobiotus metropolitanus]
MKFLVYGADGWIGSLICEILGNAGDEVLKGSRIVTIEDVWRDLKSTEPHYVVCSLGRTWGKGNNSIDYLEQPGKLTDNVFSNLTAPVLIAQATASCYTPFPVPVLYIGSGCIFEYDEKHPQNDGPGFTENDLPNFFGSAYSVVKGQTDLIMKNFSHVLSARIRMPITEQSSPRDFITKILGYNKIISVPNSVSVLSDILPFLIASLVNGKRGTINAVNPGVIEHEEIVKLYEQISGRQHVYSLMTVTEQDSILLARRSNNLLCTKLLDQWFFQLPKHLRSKYNVPEKLPCAKERIRHILAVREPKAVNAIKSKIILVTGGCGFIGSNFINYWTKQYPNDMIVNLDSLQLSANPQNIENPNHYKYHFIHGTLLDAPLITKLFQDFAFTHVVHFAAASNVDQSFSHPMDCTTSNVLGTHVLLEVVRKSQELQMLVYISTDEVYGEIAHGTSSESFPFLPTNPYAASKASAECLVMSYGKSYNIPYIITRCNNVYGPYQYPAQAIPKFCLLLLKKRRMPVHGSGHAVRRFVHVLDKCRALDIIMEKGQIGEIYNIGTLDEVSILQICELLLEEIFKESTVLQDWIDYVPDRPYNDCRYSVDFSKLKALGWKQSIEFKKGFADTVEWYKNNQNHWGSNGHLDEAFRTSDHST